MQRASRLLAAAAALVPALLLVQGSPRVLAQDANERTLKPSQAELERFRRMPRDQQVAFLASLKFAQCILLSHDFMSIDYTKEQGVEQLETKGPDKRFVDRATDSLMQVSPKTCMVAYRGSDQALAMSEFTGWLRMRDKAARIRKLDDGYGAVLTLGKTRHVFRLATIKSNGHDFIKALLIAE